MDSEGTSFPVRVAFSCEVNTTENKKKLVNSLIYLLPVAVLKDEWEQIDGRTGDLVKMKEEFARFQMRDAARAHLRSNAEGDACKFSLSKEAAAIGKTNLSTGVESPLGAIKVEMRSDDIDGVIDWLTHIEGSD